MLKDLKETIKLQSATTELIKHTQQCLIKGGFLAPGEADGIYGPKTKKAFEEFKKSAYLGELEFIGPDTVKRLLALSVPPNTSKSNTANATASIKLDVDYFYQRDNSTNLFGTGDRQCKLTCSAMLCHYLLKTAGLKDLRQLQKEGGFVEPESVYGQYLKKHGDTIYNEPHIKALKDFGIKAYYAPKLGLEGLIKLLQSGIPVPLSVDYKSGGHIVLAVGYDADHNFFWIHDPYGSRDGANHSYRDRSPLAGKYDTYSWNLLEQLWENYWNGHALVATIVGDLIL